MKKIDWKKLKKEAKDRSIRRRLIDTDLRYITVLKKQ